MVPKIFENSLSRTKLGNFAIVLEFRMHFNECRVARNTSRFKKKKTIFNANFINKYIIFNYHIAIKTFQLEIFRFEPDAGFDVPSTEYQTIPDPS